MPVSHLSRTRLEEDRHTGHRMDNGAGSGHHKGHTMPAPPRDTVITPPGTLKLAISATFHCLIGCGIGEIAGMVIAMWLGMGLMDSMILAIILGFIAGLALGIVPLFKAGFTMAEAFKTVIIAEGLSIAVMEAVEVWTQLSIPGVMEAGLTDGLFWLGMFLGLAAGFVAALPVNYVVIARGVRHQH